MKIDPRPLRWLRMTRPYPCVSVWSIRRCIRDPRAPESLPHALAPSSMLKHANCHLSASRTHHLVCSSTESLCGSSKCRWSSCEKFDVVANSSASAGRTGQRQDSFAADPTSAAEQHLHQILRRVFTIAVLATRACFHLRIS